MKVWICVCVTVASFGISFVIGGEWFPVSGSESLDHADRPGAFGALESWTAARAYPNGSIEPDKYFGAHQFKDQSLMRFESVIDGGDNWEFIGPNNFVGRMISVAVNPLNPNTVYAGAASGGLWRSYTEGLGGDWHRVMTGFPVLGVSAIAIDPGDTNAMFIGTGELYRYRESNGGILVRELRGSVGMGVLRTTDGGASWQMSLDWSYNQQRGVFALKFNPQNSSTVFAATSEGLYRSSDRGDSWSPTLEVIMTRDIAVNPIDTMEVLATCGNFGSAGHGIYRSTDGGLTFTQVPGFPSFDGMSVFGEFSGSPETIFLAIAEDQEGSIGSLWRSDDFGEAWSLVNDLHEFDANGWYSRYLAVHPEDINQIVWGGMLVHKSNDGGETFSEVFGGWVDYHASAHHPTNPDVLYSAHDGGVWRSSDFGESWHEAGVGIETAQFYNGFSCSVQDPLLAIGQVQDHFGWMYLGLESWVSGAVAEAGWTAIDWANDAIMYAVNLTGGTVYKSINRGLSFTPSGNGIYGGFGAWNTPVIISPSDPGVLYFGRSIVFKTTNAASSWTAVNNGEPLDGNPAISMAISATNPDTLYVGTGPLTDRSHLFRTTDGGTSWTDVTGVLPDRYPLDIAVDPTNSSVVYVAFGGFGVSHLFKSTDAGTTWMDITGFLPDVPATALILDWLNPDIVYAGTDIGVFVSTSGGTNWFSWEEGLPEAVLVSDLSISWASRLIRAVTHSNGVYQRTMLDPSTSVDDDGKGIPGSIVLRQNYPNPFNPSTTIRFEMPRSGEVSLMLFNLLGEEVATLVSGHRAAGSHTFQWDATGQPSGVYFYRLRAGEHVETKKLVLVR